tara:strand:+ start:719 stop:1018 length:300 start_codon:yes stop_codon:yes gene_type:complete
MPRYHYIDGVRVQFTAEEEAQADLQLQEWNNGKFDRKMTFLREKRDALLNETDWIVTKAKETGATIPTAWKTYRQSLRDITQGLTTVDEVNAVVFPTKP